MKFHSCHLGFIYILISSDSGTFMVVQIRGVGVGWGVSFTVMRDSTSSYKLSIDSP